MLKWTIWYFLKTAYYFTQFFGANENLVEGLELWEFPIVTSRHSRVVQTHGLSGCAGEMKVLCLRAKKMSIDFALLEFSIGCFILLSRVATCARNISNKERFV